VGLRPLACWDCEFESRQGQEYLSLVGVVLSGRGLWDGLITHPEKSYLVLCLSVILIPQQWRGPGLLGLSGHEKKSIYTYILLTWKISFITAKTVSLWWTAATIKMFTVPSCSAMNQEIYCFIQEKHFFRTWKSAIKVPSLKCQAHH